MAEQRLLSEDVDSACLLMRKVLYDESEYIHILRRIAAIKAVRYNLEHGLIEGKYVSSNLKEILTTQRPNAKLRVSSSKEVLDELEHGNFFPILDISTGKISFTDCFDEISKLHDDDDHCVDGKTSTSNISTTRISFTDCFDEISKLHDEDDHCDDGKTSNTANKFGSSRLSKQTSASTVASSSCNSFDYAE